MHVPYHIFFSAAHSTRVEVAPLHLLAHAHRSLATQVWESAAATAAENNASAGEGTEKSAENMQRTHAKDSSNNDAAPTTNTAAKEEESEGGKQAEQRRLQEQSMDHLRRALECFVATVRLGFDDDWQLVVETRIDLEQKESTSTSTSSPTTVT